MEAMLLLPSRLAELLPYLPRVMPALVQALGGKHELVTLVRAPPAPLPPTPPQDHVEIRLPLFSVRRSICEDCRVNDRMTSRPGTRRPRCDLVPSALSTLRMAHRSFHGPNRPQQTAAGHHVLHSCQSSP